MTTLTARPPSPARTRLLRVVGLCCATALACAVPGLSDWQFTRWGMSEAELRRASPGEPEPTSQEDRQLEVRGDGLEPTAKLDWRSGQLEFVAFFYFRADTGGLTFVKLRSTRDDETIQNLIDRALWLRYGEPESRSRDEGGLLTSIWRTETDVIAHRRGRKGIAITYEPRLNADNAGL